VGDEHISANDRRGKTADEADQAPGPLPGVGADVPRGIPTPKIVATVRVLRRPQSVITRLSPPSRMPYCGTNTMPTPSGNPADRGWPAEPGGRPGLLQNRRPAPYQQRLAPREGAGRMTDTAPQGGRGGRALPRLHQCPRYDSGPARGTGRSALEAASSGGPRVPRGRQRVAPPQQDRRPGRARAGRLAA